MGLLRITSTSFHNLSPEVPILQKPLSPLQFVCVAHSIARNRSAESSGGDFGELSRATQVEVSRRRLSWLMRGRDSILWGVLEYCIMVPEKWESSGVLINGLFDG